MEDVDLDEYDPEYLEAYRQFYAENRASDIRTTLLASSVLHPGEKEKILYETTTKRSYPSAVTSREELLENKRVQRERRDKLLESHVPLGSTATGQKFRFTATARELSPGLKTGAGVDRSREKEARTELLKSHLFTGKERTFDVASREQFEWKGFIPSEKAFTTVDLQTSHLRLAHNRDRMWETTHVREFHKHEGATVQKKSSTRQELCESHLPLGGKWDDDRVPTTAEMFKTPVRTEVTTPEQKKSTVAPHLTSSVTISRGKSSPDEFRSTQQDQFKNPMSVFMEKRKRI